MRAGHAGIELLEIAPLHLLWIQSQLARVLAHKISDVHPGRQTTDVRRLQCGKTRDAHLQTFRDVIQRPLLRAAGGSELLTSGHP